MRISRRVANTLEHWSTNAWLPVGSNTLVSVRTKQQITDKLLHCHWNTTFWDTAQSCKHVQSFATGHQINQRIKLWAVADVSSNLATFHSSVKTINREITKDLSLLSYIKVIILKSSCTSFSSMDKTRFWLITWAH